MIKTFEDCTQEGFQDVYKLLETSELNKELKEYISKNGGATCKDGSIIEPKEGYAVGTTNKVYNINEMPDFTKGLGLKGYWLDTETNEMYVDEVRIIKELSLALTIARKHGQKAIYDFKGKREIRVGAFEHGFYYILEFKIGGLFVTNVTNDYKHCAQGTYEHALKFEYFINATEVYKNNGSTGLKIIRVEVVV